MNAGMLRHRVMLQRLNDDDEWENVMVFHARINGLGGSEYWAARAVQAQDNVTFETRYIPQIAALSPQTCRLVYPADGGAIYDVQNIDDYEYRHASLKLRAVKRYGRKNSN